MNLRELFSTTNKRDLSWNKIADESSATEEPEPVRYDFDFGSFGEKDERLAEQLRSLSERFDSLVSMRDAFKAVVSPIGDTMRSLSVAQTLISEKEVALKQQKAANSILRQSVADLQGRVMDAEIGTKSLQRELDALRQQSALDDERSTQLARQINDHRTQIEDLEQKISRERDENRDLAAETARFKAAMSDKDKLLGEHESKLLELERSAFSSIAENNRLSQILHATQPDLARARQRIADLEQALYSANLAQQAREAKGLQEIKEAEQTIERLIHERTEAEAELASLALQIDGMESRHAAVIAHLDQARTFGNEKVGLLQQSQRELREESSSRQAAERRAQAAEEQLNTAASELKAVSQLFQESNNRIEMLNKAIAAKDLQLTQSIERLQDGETRLRIAARDHERFQVQAHSRESDLLQELEREKAEKALAQGALIIARTSREKLLAELEQVKRSNEPPLEGIPNYKSDQLSNVHVIQRSDAT